MIEKLQQSVDFIKSHGNFKPRVGLVLGSGLGAFVKEIKVEKSFSFNEIPHFAPTTVEGHKGNLIFGEVCGTQVVVLQGRVHFYEGHGMDTVIHPIRVMAMLGIESVLITNSAGGLDPKMVPGDFCVIEDHINLMGTNPLMGPNFKELGPRFPDMTEAYDKGLTEKLKAALTKNKINFFTGIYTGVTGPTYETPAEVRFLQLMGGKAVGMSTVPEVLAANHMGLRIAAISCITNKAAGLSGQKLSHQEVTDTAKRVELDFATFIKDFISLI